MRTPRVALLALAALACAGQVPSDMRPNDPPVIPDWVEVVPNIRYGQSPETVLDILRPKERSREKRPGVLLIHGGGWVGGTKEQRVEYAAMQYLRKGFVVANVEYRLAKVAPAPAAVTDILEAAEWFRKNAKHYNVDSKRIVATGDSAGGHLALMAGLTPKSAKLGPVSNVAAVVNFYGITDVADQLHGPNERPYAVTWIPGQDGRMELAARVSPVTYVRKDVPPVISIHGDADETVPYAHAANLTRLLTEKGARAILRTATGLGHSMPKEHLDGEYERIWIFLREAGILR